MTHRGKIPRPTVKRLSLYLRQLEGQAAAGGATISSRQLGEALDLTDAQVRKDLAYFGQFGHPGIGYRIGELIGELKKILGTDRRWRTAVVGAGNLGRAITSYGRLETKGFEIAAVFDVDPEVVGQQISGVAVRPQDQLTTVVPELSIEIALLTVPAAAAQGVADLLVESGIRGILNFAPVRLNVAPSVSVVSVDFTASLEQLAFRISLAT